MCSPRGCPCYVCTPVLVRSIPCAPLVLIRTLLRLFVLPALASCSFVPSPVLRSYRMCSFEPPTLPSCSLVLALSRLYRPRGSVRTPCARSNPPALVRTPRTRLVLAHSRFYRPWGSVRTPCTHSSPPPCVPLVAAAAIAAATAHTLSLAPWSMCPRPAFAFLSVVPYL